MTVFRNSGATLIDILDNDSDPDNDTLTVTNVIQPANGTVVNNGTSLTYTPNNGYVGIDTFQYTVDDGNGGQATATVSVEVLNNAPVAVDDTAIAVGSEQLIIDILSNDSDSDGNSLTTESVSHPTNGIVVINPDGSVTYQANEDFVGTDTFTYVVADEDGTTASATVTVTVESDNNAPAAIDDLYLVSWGGSLDFNPMENDSDADGDAISLVSVDTSTLNGTLVVHEDGSMSYQAPGYFSGNDIFTYTIVDSNGATSTATVTMCVGD